jgi:hypothetical protein
MNDKTTPTGSQKPTIGLKKGVKGDPVQPFRFDLEQTRLYPVGTETGKENHP